MEQNTSQGSVATCAWCGGIINNQFAANLKENLSVEEFWKSVEICQELSPRVWCLVGFPTRFLPKLKNRVTRAFSKTEKLVFGCL